MPHHCIALKKIGANAPKSFILQSRPIHKGQVHHRTV